MAREFLAPPLIPSELPPQEVICGASAAILQILPKASHQDKRPANALIARAVQFCDEERIPYLVYGLLNYGNQRQGTLLRKAPGGRFTFVGESAKRFASPATLFLPGINRPRPNCRI